MKLFLTTTSPYCRKVRIVAHERGLDVEECIANPLDDPPHLRASSAIGKIPVLVVGRDAIYDSRVICEYLDEQGPAPSLLPRGDAVWIDRTRAALGEGLMDAALAIVMEGRRMEGERSRSWVERQSQRVLGIVRAAEPGSSELTIGDISLACGLSYLDFRLPRLPWRTESSTLAAWHLKVEARDSFCACPLG